MSAKRAEVPPHGPPSPMAALLAAFVGGVGLLWAWYGVQGGAGGRPAASVGVIIAVVSFAASPLLYARYRKRRDAFDEHILHPENEP